MGNESKIQWTNSTWNPWHGCHKVSPGCKFCYMYRDKERYGLDPTVIVRSAEKTFMAPKAWNEPRLVFTCSWSDFFIEEADEWRDEAWKVIRDTPRHTYQILTKRPERIMECLPPNWGFGYSNVWLGTSVENQQSANERIGRLCSVPAKFHFISAEPLLEMVNLGLGKTYTSFAQFVGTVGDIESIEMIPKGIDWVIIGGESGNTIGKYSYRECKGMWIDDIIKQCSRSNNIPVFVKQLGTHLATLLMLKDKHGGDIEEWPEHLRIRQFPILKD